MAKESMKARERKRAKMVEKYAEKRNKREARLKERISVLEKKIQELKD